MNFAAQLLSTIGAILMIVAIQLPKKDKLLIFYGLGGFCFGISFILLKGYPGGIICVILAMQTFISYIYEKKSEIVPKYVMYLTLSVALIAGIYSYQNIYSILPLACSILHTAIMMQKDMRILRILRFIILICWIFYEVIIGAYAAIISDSLGLISTVIAIYRFDILKRSKNNETKRK